MSVIKMSFIKLSLHVTRVCELVCECRFLNGDQKNLRSRLTFRS